MSQGRHNKRINFCTDLKSNVTSPTLDSLTPLAVHEPDLLALPKVTHRDEDAPDMLLLMMMAKGDAVA